MEKIKRIEVKRGWDSPQIEVGITDDKVYVAVAVDGFLTRAAQCARDFIVKEGIPTDTIKKEFLAMAQVKKLRWSVREATILRTLEEDFDHGVLMSIGSLRATIRAAIEQTLRDIFKELKDETKRII